MRSLFHRILRVTKRIALTAWNHTVEFYLRLKIRLKLSLIVGASIAIVTLVVSAVKFHSSHSGLCF
jgi:hypothetical protein